MDRRANHNSGLAVWMVMLAVAGALWNCGTVSGAVGNVYPVDGSVTPGTVYTPTGNIYTFLDASPDPNAASYVCYFSHIEAEVAGRVEDANIGPQLSSVPNLRWIVGLPDDVHPGDPYPDGLVGGTKYSWAVDAFDALDNKFAGDVWEFTVRSHSYYATNPDPPNDAVGVEIPVLLCWQSGLEVDFHVIYFSTSFDDVNNGKYEMYMPPPPWTQPGDDEDWDPVADGGLTIEFGTTYYWRVDEVSGRFMPGTGTIYKGDVWCFTTKLPPIYVDTDAAGANDGSSWEDAYNFLQDALIEADSALKPVEIWVAESIYKPDQGGGQTTGDRTATFKLINGVTLKGGYAGFGEPDPDTRDIKLYETILSGDLDGNDIEVADPCDLLTEPTRAENSYHVVTCNGTDANAILDGFTITGGNADGGSPPICFGGGMYNEYGSPTVINCTFSDNFSINGGGMYNYSGGSTLTNCNFSNNLAGDGGGMLNEKSNIMLINCTFSGNSAIIYAGGGMYDTHSYSTVVNCTFSQNSSKSRGGGMHGAFSEPTLINCILWGNASDRGSQIGMKHDSMVEVSYCNVQGGISGVYLYHSSIDWRDGNIDADPCFADPNNGDYHLKSQAGRWDANSESWVVDDVTSSCIDAGNPGCPEANEPSPNGNRRNMGAYGGTAEASKSPANWRSIADMTNDWVVDYNDLRIYVDYWLESGECIPSDFDRSQFVDFGDFAIFGLHWSYPSSGPGINYQIEKCDPNSFRSLATEPATETRFSVIVEGSYIHFKDMMVANCCPDELGLEMTVENNLITILETEYTPGGCYCICDYPVTATLGLFEAGTYTLEVYEDWGGFIGSTTVIIEPPQ
jgi:hypothetical protein